MQAVLAPTTASQSRTFSAINSGPLSERTGHSGEIKYADWYAIDSQRLVSPHSFTSLAGESHAYTDRPGGCGWCSRDSDEDQTNW